MPKAVALIPARAGSSRVAGKNIRPLAGHPLLAYSVAGAVQSGLFDRVIVSTDSEHYAKIALHYGAEVPFIRPAELATSISPDIEWIKHALGHLDRHYECFSIVRPTSPFRLAATFRRAWDQLMAARDTDSIRAVQLCHEHPGKMWTLKGTLMAPLLAQSDEGVPWHDRQYQDLPKVYVQNSALEIAWTRVVHETNTRGGWKIAPFFTEGHEGFSIDYQEDWQRAELLVRDGAAELPPIAQAPFP
jgi:CMP-N,N'-diacetyllegionaminic acid synthase